MRKDEKIKKLNNKGFSLVEIIIVIAIMAILAGALAPQLFKYIDKSRKAADIQIAQTIATAVNTALAEESSYDSAVSTKLSECYKADIDGNNRNAFQKKIKEILGGNDAPKPKYNVKTYKDFWIEVNQVDKSFQIFVGDAKPTSTDDEKDLILYPTVGENYK